MTTVVCLHGASSSPKTWDHLRAGLRQHGIASHAITLLGHRGAARPGHYPLTAFRDDALSEVDRLQLDSVALVGHSLGAFVATLVATHRRQLVRRLVLEEPPVPPTEAADGRPVSRGCELRMRLTAPLAWRRCDPRLLGQVLDEMRRPQPQWWRSMSRFDTPTLLVAGGRTSHVNQNGIARLAATLPDARLRTVPAGHRVHTSRPDQYLDVVVPFLVESATDEP